MTPSFRASKTRNELNPTMGKLTSNQFVTQCRAMEHLLTARIGLLLTRTVTFPASREMAETVVSTDRLILLQRGRLHYRTEQVDQNFSSGTLLLVPAWTRRSWRVISSGGCRMAWVEFAIMPVVGSLPAVQIPRLSPEKTRGMRKIIQLASSDLERDRLLAEMELKHLLAWIVCQGSRTQTPSPSAVVGDVALTRAIDFLRDHLKDAEVLSRLPRASGMSPHRLRARFRQTVGMSPSRYIEMMRMQRARFLLMASDKSIKQIAGLVGFDDPLYFSRRYRRFWSRSPSEDRTPNP